jgi:hypothetical protein
MTINNALVEGIFQIPIYRNILSRDFSKQELNFVNKTKEDVFKNRGNVTSNDTYILNKPAFKNLKKELDLMVQDYFNKVLCVPSCIIPYITQSWLNYTEVNEYHHEHHHPNSLVSGVIYLNADSNTDKITFSRREKTVIELDFEDVNLYNAPFWDIPVKTGHVVLFPSTLGHMVTTKEGNNSRVSLAFNTFVKGTIGTGFSLKKLIL